MKIIGITGGVGCGKSSVLKLLEKLTNSYIIMADDVAKGLYTAGSPLVSCIGTEFGKDCINADGSVNTGALAGIIYSDESKRQRLNSIVHPQVRHIILDKIDELKESESYDYVFVEAALFFEAGFQLFCDEIWYVSADIGKRRERLKKERGYSDEKIDAILKTQMSEDDFAKRCDCIIDNSGTLSETERILVKML